MKSHAHKFINNINSNVNSINIGLDYQNKKNINSLSNKSIDLSNKSIDLSNIYGKCGIITACLIDPLSQLINKILGLNDDDINSIGFYYESDNKNEKSYTVILFNIYDNYPISWLRLGCTMDLLLGSPFVIKISYYPLITSDNSGTFLTRNSMDIKPVNDKLESNFRTIVIQEIGINANSCSNKNLSYTSLLLQIANVKNDIDDLKIIKTGYTLVNKVLLSLMGINKFNDNKISNSIISCPLIKQPITINNSREIINEIDTKYIIEECRTEIINLLAVFIDLFTTNDEFKNNVINLRVNKSNDFKPNNPKALDNLFLKESDLISHIIGGLQNGIISKNTLNEIIHDLNIERFHLGNYDELPLSVDCQPQIQITNNNIMCTFQQNSVTYNTDPLQDLGDYLNHIVQSFNSSESLTINLGTIISHYNKSIQDTNIEKITIPNIQMPGTTSSSNTLSRSAVVIIPSIPNGENMLLPQNIYNRSSNTHLESPEPDSDILTNNKIINIPMYNANIESFTDTLLLDILIYIDSLRDTNGMSDIRFANLQNEISNELALRKRNNSH